MSKIDIIWRGSKNNIKPSVNVSQENWKRAPSTRDLVKRNYVQKALFLIFASEETIKRRGAKVSSSSVKIPSMDELPEYDASL